VNRLAIHAQHEADQGLGLGKEMPDVMPLIRQLRAINVNKTDVVSPGCKTKVAELLRVEHGRRSHR
jgi:hypothetical protein